MNRFKSISWFALFDSKSNGALKKAGIAVARRKLGATYVYTVITFSDVSICGYGTSWDSKLDGSLVWLVVSFLLSY